MFTNESASENFFENRSTFGEVMDNIIVDCFFYTHSVQVKAGRISELVNCE